MIDKFILGSVIVLLQWHGIQFWYGQVGYSGILWSVILEVAALRLWYLRVSYLALLCSLLIILGPLYHISAPIIQNTKLMQSYELELQIDAKQAKGGIGNLTRLGVVEQARKDAKATLEKYRETLVGAHWWVILIQAAGLVFLQWAQILLARRLGRPDSNAAKRLIKALATGRFTGEDDLIALFGVSKQEEKQAFRWLIQHKFMTIQDGKARLIRHGNLNLDDIKL